ncbi:MAG: ROK family protein [Butyricicoccus sp.]
MKASEKLSASEVRRINRNRVYMYLYSQELPKTKRDIEQNLHVSMPTVTQNLKELLEKELIAYVGTEESTGGRKARQIAINPLARFAVGIEISPKHIRYVAVDLCAQEIAYSQIAEQFRAEEAFFALLAKKLEEFLDEFALDRAKLLGIGITVPGIVDRDGGVVTIAPVLGVRKLMLRQITEKIPYPAFVQNDASAGGMAEWWHSRTEGSMAYLFLGKGVGGSIFLEGKLYNGEHGRSAEFGHTCIVPGGKPCNCGKRGCLEAYCSIARLTDDLGKSSEEFFAMLDAGDTECERIWKEYLDYLALGIHNIDMAFDCKVMLGGVISPYLVEYLPALELRLQRLSAFEQEPGFLHIGACGSKANCIGVALYFIKQFIEQV